MTGVVVFGRYFLIAAGLAFAATYALPVLAQSSGYEGLIAPAAPETRHSSDDNEDSPASTGPTAGYDGVLAPVPSPSARQEEAPAGYEGLLPGRAAAPRVTALPGTENFERGRPNIRTLSTIYGQDRDDDGVPDGIREPRKIIGAENLSYIEGKPSMEYVAEQQVTQMMSAVADGSLSPEAHAENVRLASRQLGAMATGLRSKQGIPDRIYKKMGLSDAYIQQEKDSTANALALLNKSLKELRQYQ